MNNNPGEAWEVYLQIEDSTVAYEVLQLIGNDCYKMGCEGFIYSAMAFNELLKMDSYEDYYDGFIGSCVGVLKNHINDQDRDNSKLSEVVNMLESYPLPKCNQVANSIRRFMQQG